ncbi:MAG: V-type ATP synthase subunit A, partial [Chlamydiia bacterium]|nr:V-type ATP synthase subunit A [Chlamydiia bacterium]
MSQTTGSVSKAFGNLLHVVFEGDVRQGEVGFVEVQGLKLKAEVIEIAGREAKVQVFEDTRGVKCGSQMTFTTHLLEAELGPGLISSIIDGLQNPLEKVADATGVFLTRGTYVAPLDHSKRWDFQPTAQIGDQVERGDFLGFVMEGRFHHQIMVPFKMYGTYTVSWIAKPGNYTLDNVIAKLKSDKGIEHEITMVQKWPVKLPLFKGTKVKAKKMMDTGLRTIDTMFPLVKGGTFCSPGPFGAGKTVMQHHLSK